MKNEVLTDIAPDQEVLPNVSIPDNGVHAIDDIQGKQPDDDGDGSDVSRAPVSR